MGKVKGHFGNWEPGSRWREGGVRGEGCSVVSASEHPMAQLSGRWQQACERGNAGGETLIQSQPRPQTGSSDTAGEVAAGRLSPTS